MNAEEHFTEGERLLDMAADSIYEDAFRLMCSTRSQAHFSAALAASQIATQARANSWMNDATAAWNAMQQPASQAAPADDEDEAAKS